jgi:hypothetical protein
MTDTKNATYMDKAKAAGYNPALVRKPKNDEAFQVQIPGLADGVTVPVYEADLVERAARTAEYMGTQRALANARGAIEAADLSFSTRTATPESIFVLALVPFKNRAKRAEVSYDEATGYQMTSYKNNGAQSTFDLTVVVEQLRSELLDD